jgi:hypothetical protein
MQINRHNYEEYFILYMDNELGATDRRMVEDFVKLHPDLQEELEMLLQSRFTPDTAIVFENKNELLFDASSGIQLSNFEEWAVLYMDNELDPSQRMVVDQMAAENPEARFMMDQVLRTRLQPENILFPDKASLYRKEERVRFAWWQRMSAAAILLLIAGASAFLLLNNSPVDTIDVVAATPGKLETRIPQQKAVVDQPGTKEENTDENIEALKEVENEPQQVSTMVVSNKRSPSKTDEVPVEVVSIEKLSGITPVEKMRSENISTTNVNIANMVSADGRSHSVQMEPVKTDLTNSPDNPIAEDVTNDIVQASFQSDGKKNKLRGFFRKVTRTFEKRTNIDATDDDDRLLVGGLAIRL